MLGQTSMVLKVHTYLGGILLDAGTAATAGCSQGLWVRNLGYVGAIAISIECPTMIGAHQRAI